LATSVAVGKLDNQFDKKQERSYEEITFRIIAGVIVRIERVHIVRATAPGFFGRR
jgi:hypothetical protein